MDQSRVIDIIRSQDSLANGASGIGFVTNFAAASHFKVEYSQYGQFFGDIIELTRQNLGLMNQESKEHDYVPQKYGLPFCEEIPDTMPIIVDFLIRCPNNDAFHLYPPEFVCDIVKSIQDIICSFIVVMDADIVLELVCFVLESPIWVDKDGHQCQKLRFQFPYTRISKAVLNGFLRKELIFDLQDNDLIKKIYRTPIDTNWDVIIQRFDNCVSLYGSKLHKDEAPMVLRGIFSYIDYVPEGIEEESTMESYISFDNDDLDPMDNSLVCKGLIDKDSLIFNDKIDNILLILSIHFYDKFSPIKPGVIQMGDDIPTPKPFVPSLGGFAQEENQEELFDVLIQLVDPKRFTKQYKYYWYSIGKCIHNIFGSSDYGKSKFVACTSEELKPELDKTWELFASEYLDIRTIMGYARVDNPEAYTRWHHDYCKQLVVDAVGGKDMVMANLVRRVLCLDYLYCRESGTWYYIKKSKLQKDIQGLELRNVINERIKPFYLELRAEYDAQFQAAATPDQRKIFRGMVAEVDKLTDKLDTVAFLDKVINAAKSKLYDDNFNQLRDENNKLMACTNCVIECYDKTITHRPFKIQDYITKCTQIPFPMSYTMDTRQVQFLMKYYGQVHTDRELFHFFMKDLGSFMEGGNDEKYFRNWIGESNASKSQVVKLLQLAFGDYCVDFPTDEITINRNKSASGPNHALELAKGARIAIVAETDKSEPLHVGKVKKFTGNDRYYNRSLNKEGGSRCLSFVLIHMSNVMAERPNSDEAYLIREIIYPFLSKWVPHAPPTEEEQYAQRLFQMDLDFSKILPSLAQAQLFLMFHYYPIYKEEGIRQLPEIIKEKTQRFHEDNDPFFNFIKTQLEIVEIEGEHSGLAPSIGVFDLFTAYRRWYPKFAATPLMINQNDFKNEMILKNRLGPLNHMNEWSGFQFKQRTH